jgi:hypothetical protein
MFRSHGLVSHGAGRVRFEMPFQVHGQNISLFFLQL